MLPIFSSFKSEMRLSFTASLALFRLQTSSKYKDNFRSKDCFYLALVMIIAKNRDHFMILRAVPGDNET